MEVIIYLSLAILFLIFIFLIIHSQAKYLILHPNKYDKTWNGHEIFSVMVFATIRYFLRRGNVYLKFSLQYLLHFWVKFLSFTSDLFDKVYTISRNKFVYTAVLNKSTVPHFWNTLKKYKKEIDEEKGNKIDDTGMDGFGK